MRVTGTMPFGPVNNEGESLFSVRPGIRLKDALQTLCNYLDVLNALTSAAAEDLDGGGNPDCRLAHAAHYLGEAAQAIAETVLQAENADRSDFLQQTAGVQ